MATEETTISDLELTEDILPDMLTPVENASETKATTFSAIKNWLTGFFVSKTENNIIYGSNTFNGNNTFSAEKLFIKNYTNDISTAPTNNQASSIYFKDKNDKLTGYIQNWHETNGKNSIVISASGQDEQKTYLFLTREANGASYATVPSPATTDNSYKVATTNFVNNFFNTAGKVTTKCMPNYAAGVSISSNYTAPSDGFIFCGLAGNGSESTTINGKQIAVTYDTGVSGSLPQICAPVSKGDVFKTNSKLNWGTFFPSKGA